MISSAVETTQNIKNAFAVVRKTYENLHKLFSELDAVSTEQGFVPISPGYFLRWRRSDQDWEYGWLIVTFIKLFQSKDDGQHLKIENLRQGPIYGVGAWFDEEPLLYLSRFDYDLSSWTGLPTPGDYKGFSEPIWNKRSFDIKEQGSVLVSVPKGPRVKESWGLERVVFRRTDLVSVNSSEAIKRLVFSPLKDLAKIGDQGRP
jgi:hypothetical protein